jgi:hypothetical protein
MDDGNNIFDLEAQKGFKASGEDDDDSDEASVADESSEGCWNQDDAIIYYSHSELNLPTLRRHPSKGSQISLGAQTLSSGFTLSDLGSIATVSSLGNYDNADSHDSRDFGNTLVTIDGVGLISLDTLSKTGTPQSLCKRALRRSPHSQDTIDELASLDSTDRKIRQVEQKIEAHQLQEAFSPIHGLVKGFDGEEHADDEIVEEEVSIEEIIEEEYEEEELSEENHDAQVRQISSAVLKSMVITTKWQSTEFSSIQSRESSCSLEDTILRQESVNPTLPQRHPLHHLDKKGIVQSDFPAELLTAKDFLV